MNHSCENMKYRINLFGNSLSKVIMACDLCEMSGDLELVKVVFVNMFAGKISIYAAFLKCWMATFLLLMLSVGVWKLCHSFIDELDKLTG